MITGQIESFAATLPELRALLDDHHRELGNYVEKMPLDPEWNDYLAMERAGTLMFLTVREDGVLVGYYIGIVKGGLHYRSTLTNKMDIFYTVQGKRGRGIGQFLFEQVKKENQRIGVKFWRVGGKVGTHAPKFFESLGIGFEKIEEHYAVWLGD